MASSSRRPLLLVADTQGNILDYQELFMVCRRGKELALPRPDDLSPLLGMDKIFFLPERQALALDEENGELVVLDENAVAAVVPDGYIITAHAAYMLGETAPRLPSLPYAAVGFANGRFYACAKKIDTVASESQPNKKLRKQIRLQMDRLQAAHLNNSYIQELLKYSTAEQSPFVQAFTLGKTLLPLPLGSACNAHCAACTLGKEVVYTPCAKHLAVHLSPFAAQDIVAVMQQHIQYVATMSNNDSATPEAPKQASFVFGSDYAGEPLLQAKLIAEILEKFRSAGHSEAVHLVTNGSLPDAVELLADAGLSTLRIRLNSARDASYARYHQPQDYSFAAVRQSIHIAKQKGLQVSLGLLYFPGFTDTEDEFAALVELCTAEQIDFLRLENLALEPEAHLALMDGIETGPIMSFFNFHKRLKKEGGMQVGFLDPVLTV